MAETQNTNIDEIALECARFIVCCEGSKASIKKADIIKHLETSQNKPRGFYKQTIQKALQKTDNILKHVYGYKLVSIASDTYIVILNEPCETNDLYNEDERRLLIVTLTHIFMSGGSVAEDKMMLFLKNARLVQDNDDQKKRLLLTKIFTKQLYLEYKKQGDGDESGYVFQWGKRAEHEVSKEMLLKKMSDALEKPVEYWKVQLTAATSQNIQENN